jgi:GT2 family glycosyltransferase
MKFAIVIPNYNGRELLGKNLPTIIKNFPEVPIVIVDDASTDGSVEMLKKTYPKITVIEKITNSGFATTVNIGFKAAKADVVILLNSDIVVKSNFLSKLERHFQNEKLFAVGFCDEDREENRTIKRGRGVGSFRRGFLIHKRGEISKDNTLWASGGSSAFRKSYWEQLGGLSELYQPFYWEDIDISYRALKAGLAIDFDSEIVVEHHHHEGSISRQFNKTEIKKIAYRNQILFVWANITDTYYIISHVFWLPYHLSKALIGGDLVFISGFIKALVLLPQILKKRSTSRSFFKKSDALVLTSFSYE